MERDTLGCYNGVVEASNGVNVAPRWHRRVVSLIGLSDFSYPLCDRAIQFNRFRSSSCESNRLDHQIEERGRAFSIDILTYLSKMNIYFLPFCWKKRKQKKIVTTNLKWTGTVFVVGHHFLIVLQQCRRVWRGVAFRENATKTREVERRLLSDRLYDEEQLGGSDSFLVCLLLRCTPTTIPCVCRRARRPHHSRITKLMNTHTNREGRFYSTLYKTRFWLLLQGLELLH